MKKLLYSILALSGLAMVSCTQEHIDVQYTPENAVAPVLGAIEGCDLSEGGNDIVVEYTKADFGVATANVHNLYIAKTEDMADMKKAKATFNDANITLTQADLNVVALEFGNAGEPIDLYFAVVANLNTDKGAAVAGSELMSNVVKATFKSYVADVLPTEKFEKVWVIGNYCGWDHAKTQFLFDYNSTGTTFAGVVDFADAEGVSLANTGFKLTGIAGWDDACNWGEETKATEADEPASIQLITGGGSQDIMRYAKRFYGFEFDNTTLVLKKSWGADQIGIIGLNGDWDNDIVMNYNPKWTRFYADIEASADTEMKFRADAAWDLNWGAECAQGGDNIAVAAGKYRVYFNPVTGLIDFNAKNYGTEEDTGAGGETPDVPEGPVTEPDRWGVVGTITEWGGQADLYMSEVGENLFARNGVTVTADDQFKIRFNNDWAVNYGAAGDVEPFAVTVGEKLTLAAGGKNLSAPAGTYDIYFNISTFDIWVMAEGETPDGVDVKSVKLYAHKEGTAWAEMALYGWDGYDFGGWPGILLTEKETIDGKEFFVYEFPATAYGITTNIIFNNNNNGEQTQDITGIVLNRDYYFIIPAEAENGRFMAYEMGTEPVKPSFPVLTEHSWGVIGSFNNWGGDVAMEIADGVATATIEIPETDADKKFKVRADGDWANNFGYSATEEAPLAPVDGTEFAATFNGSDIVVEAAGKYQVSLRIENEQGYLKIAKL
ncbi:MAG: starch-binding protein [Rikenellaceae bacterium]|nr:starch-binding protein [Rikenellaceae bacterium]